jgi:hypothetical protein
VLSGEVVHNCTIKQNSFTFELKLCQQLIEEQYRAKHELKKLHWLVGLACTVEIQFSHSNGSTTLYVSPLQACILNQFNEKSTVAIQDLITIVCGQTDEEDDAYDRSRSANAYCIKSPTLL